ncbi:GDSL-type esterase/lipase family protein [Inquilinus limosus]|uniref:SGNH hydrolase-type esterase domain-containing protein n=1 Tax=Inquilinus limosus MP06 TaxID=1398085 RepID=A0A0A0DE18_9PROT|nr:GDSL-type esterase/lipase family protein [Inquilinus limosus]KGM36143.1 hypothetical protein P409_00410 [Inquilinus limosus MP06]
MIRFSYVFCGVLALALCGVALESQLPQRIAARFGWWPEVMGPARYVDEAAAELQEVYPTRKADIVMLGDSLTAAADWRELLPNWDVVNRGVAGETIREISARVDAVGRLHPRVVFLMAGTNDLMVGQTPNEVAESYRLILDRLQSTGAKVVVQPVLHVAKDRNTVGIQRFWYNRRNDAISDVNARIRAIAEKRGLVFLDLNETIAPDGVLADDLTSDGTHLRAPAYLLWAKAINDVLSAPGLLAERRS